VTGPSGSCSGTASSGSCSLTASATDSITVTYADSEDPNFGPSSDTQTAPFP
jgi:hypothetical protein